MRVIISIGFGALREVASRIQCRRQLQDYVRQRGVLQQLSNRQWRLAPRSLVSATERSVQAQDHVTEYKSQDKGPQEIVSEELHIGRI